MAQDLPPLRIFSTLAVIAVVKELLPEYERRSGLVIEAEFAPTTVIAGRLAAGETCDVVILTSEGIDKLVEEGAIVAGSKRDIASTSVGIAVKAGAPKPDISTTDAFFDALNSVPSIALSQTGASGINFRSVLDRLGLTDAIAPKVRTIPSGFTGELAADGRAEWALQQISELAVVPGIEIVGPLPKDIGSETLFSAAVLVSSRRASEAFVAIAHLAQAEHNYLYRRAGLDPVAADITGERL